MHGYFLFLFTIPVFGHRNPVGMTEDSIICPEGETPPKWMVDMTKGDFGGGGGGPPSDGGNGEGGGPPPGYGRRLDGHTGPREETNCQIVMPISCGVDFTSSETALPVENINMSWATYHYFDCLSPAHWMKFTNDISADWADLVLGAGSPYQERFQSLKPVMLLMGPGLPELTAEELAQIPEVVKSDPAFVSTGILYVSPADQTTCDHLSEIMKKHSKPESKYGEEVCVFHEEYMDNDYAWMLDVAVPSVPEMNGEYYIVTWLQDNMSGKLSISYGTWAEDFRSEYKEPDIHCPASTFLGLTYDEKGDSALVPDMEHVQGEIPAEKCPENATEPIYSLHAEDMDFHIHTLKPLFDELDKGSEEAKKEAQKLLDNWEQTMKDNFIPEKYWQELEDETKLHLMVNDILEIVLKLPPELLDVLVELLGELMGLVGNTQSAESDSGNLDLSGFGLSADQIAALHSNKDLAAALHSAIKAQISTSSAAVLTFSLLIPILWF